MKICIYKIENKVDGKVYIGQTINYNKRFRTHITKLNGGYHHNEHLQRAWNKYGECSFKFEIIKECTLDEIDKLEKYYIDKFNSLDRNKGYNMVDGGQKFRIFSPELRNKMSKSLTGRTFSEEHRIKISKSNIGKTISKISIEKANKTKRDSKCHWGQKNPNAIITDDIAKQILIELKDGVNVSEIVEKYKVTKDIVYNLKNNRSYTYILPEIRENIKHITKYNLNNRIKQAIEMYNRGMSQNAIAKELNISRNTLRRELINQGINTKKHINQYVNTEVNI